MPTYDYVCDECGHKFEEFQSITAKPLKKCPACGKRRLQRLIGTGGGVIFKGSGFYETDYRSESYKKAAEADKPTTGGGTDKKDAGKPDTAKQTGTSSKSSSSRAAQKAAAK